MCIYILYVYVYIFVGVNGMEVRVKAQWVYYRRLAGSYGHFFRHSSNGSSMEQSSIKPQGVSLRHNTKWNEENDLSLKMPGSYTSLAGCMNEYLFWEPFR